MPVLQKILLYIFCVRATNLVSGIKNAVVYTRFSWAKVQFSYGSFYLHIQSLLSTISPRGLIGFTEHESRDALNFNSYVIKCCVGLIFFDIALTVRIPKPLNLE